MELIYLYIKKYGDFIENQGFSFSNKFEVKMENNCLLVNKKQDYLKDFYGKKITNISVLVGQNGSGKTTILDILGMSRNDRFRSSGRKKEVEGEYFLLYYIGNIKGNDLFGIEITTEGMLQGLIKNCKQDNRNFQYNESKKFIGEVYKYENDSFISIGKHFFDKVDNNHHTLSEEISFSYINEIYRYSSRNRGGLSWNGGYTVKRSLATYPTVSKKYSIIVRCINKQIKGINFDKIVVCFEDDIDYWYKMEERNLEKYKEIFSDIERNLYITKGANDDWRIPNVYTQNNRSIVYIKKIYSRYIMDMIVGSLFDACRYNRNTGINNGTIKNTNCFVETSETIDYIKELKSNQSSQGEFGKPIDFEKEILNIAKVSKQLKEVLENREIEYLKLLARYVGSRLHSDEENNEFRYIEAFEEIVNSLLEIPEECFNNENVKITVSDCQEELVSKLLKVYDCYANRENFQSDIHSKFKISFKGLSEGEERLVDIISKIGDSVKENEEAKLLILLFDEPDQSLHPEWSRRFIDILTQVIESIEFRGNIQLILSTHSPYLLSDILPDGILKLKRGRNDEGRMLKVVNGHEDKKVSGLGANIYDLMQNEFFMENTVGEFATKKINGYIRKIHELTRNSEDIQEIEYFIEQIGEPIIKKGMKRQLEGAKYKLNLKENDNKLLALITDECDRKKVAAYLQTIGEQK